MAHDIEIRCSIQLSYERMALVVSHFIEFSRQFGLACLRLWRERKVIEVWRNAPFVTQIPVKNPELSFPSRSRVLG